MSGSNYILIAISLIFLALPLTCQVWNPDAGLIPSYSEGASMSASSEGTGLPNVIDNNINTHWQSDAPLPMSFQSRSDQNVLLGTGAVYGTVSGNGSAAEMTDGNFSTYSSMQLIGGNAWAQLVRAESGPLKLITLRLFDVSVPVQVYIFTSNVDSVLVGTYAVADNFQIVRIEIDFPSVAKIELRSSAPCSVSEISGLSSLPKEFVTVDFGELKSVGVVKTRHWAGPNTAVATEILLSENGIDWVKVADLNPNSLHPVYTRIEVTSARFLRLSHTLSIDDWNKVFVWEIDAWDEHGDFGPPPPFIFHTNSIRDMLGVNSIWGWGHNVYSNLLQQGQGPQLYNKVASHARNYHFMPWDVSDPDHLPDYSAMALGQGTEVHPWLNWDQEYRAWQNASLQIDMCVNFWTLTEEMWDTPFQSAYNFGRAFASHFGPVAGNGLAYMMEVGNEPWDFSAATYSEILEGMSMGAKTGDPAMKVLPCALQSRDKDVELSSPGNYNYTGARISPQAAAYIDGLNLHYYSFFTREDGVRIAVHPEHPFSEMRSIINDRRFRDTNMPGKGLYVTEYGWDSNGASEDCNFPECVDEAAQAIYGVRATLFFARMGVDKMNWFFYANETGEGLFSRSGLRGSFQTGFAPKRSFSAFEALVNTIGDKHLVGIAREDEWAWIYYLGNETGDTTHLVAWRPVPITDTSSILVQLSNGLMPLAAWKLGGLDVHGDQTSLPDYDGAAMQLILSATPLVVSLAARSTSVGHTIPVSTFHKVFPTIVSNASSTVHIQPELGREVKKIRLFDSAGRICLSMEMNGQGTFSTETLAAGMYILQLIDDYGCMQTTRLIVHK